MKQDPIPIPKAGEVFIETRAVSTCGSDLGAYRLHEVSDVGWNKMSGKPPKN